MIPQFQLTGAARRTARYGQTHALAVAIWIASHAAVLAHACADVELVLAIDGSGSINSADFSLQQQGYVSAFRRRDVQEALQAAGVVDIAVVLWGDTEMAIQVLPWTRVTDAASAEALATNINGFVRRVSGNTGLGRAVWVALDLFEDPGRCGHRRIINVSGDGLETISPRAPHHVPLARSRRRAEEMNVVINALAIETEVADLGAWYRDRLLVGPGAFVMRVDGFDSFAEAIARKLIREIAPPEVASSPASPDGSKI